MTKAMGYVCLLALMFAFGVPEANAAKCTGEENDKSDGLRLSVGSDVCVWCA